MTTATMTTNRVDTLIDELATRILYFHREGIAKRYRTVRHWTRMHHAYDRLVEAIGKEEALIQWHGILAYHTFRDFEPRDTTRLFGVTKPEHRYIPWTYDDSQHDPTTWADPFQGDWVDTHEDDPPYAGTNVLELMEELESLPFSDVPQGIPTQAQIDADFAAWEKADPYQRGKRPYTRLEHIGMAYYRWLKDECPAPPLNDEGDMRPYYAEIGAYVTQRPQVKDQYMDDLSDGDKETLKTYHKLLYTFFKDELDTDRPVELSLDEHYRTYKRPLGPLTLRGRGEPEMQRQYTDGITATNTMQVFKQMSADTFYAYFRARHETMRITADLKDLLDTTLPTVDTRIRNLLLAYWHDFHHHTDYMQQVIRLYRVHQIAFFEEVCELAMQATMVEPTPSDILIAGAFEKEMRYMKRTETGLYRKQPVTPQETALRAG